MDVDIRPITDDEVPAWVESLRVGFLGHAADGEAEHLRAHLDLSRTLGAFDADRVVGTLRSFTTDLTVPGGEARCAALTSVTVAATHRRRGLLTGMLTRDLEESVERGEIVGALIAAEYPIYGRFGYGAAADAVDLELSDQVRFQGPRDRGVVEYATGAELRSVAPEIYRQVKAASPGAIERRPHVWDYDLGLAEWPGHPHKPNRFFVIGRDETGAADGYAVYRVEDHWDRGRPKGTLHLEELLAVDGAAERRLWQFCVEVDWIGTVKAENRPVEGVVAWLVEDAREVIQLERGDFEWVRILDVPAALSTRRYASAGSVTIRIHDPQGHAAGTFALDGGPDGAECQATTASPDLEIGVSELGSAYLGGVGLMTLHRAGRIDELTPGAVARADALFRWPVSPWVLTHF